METPSFKPGGQKWRQLMFEADEKISAAYLALDEARDSCRDLDSLMFRIFHDPPSDERPCLVRG